MADDFKYHIDHHSSLITPAELAEARIARVRGDIDDAQLRSVEDRLIKDALHTQRRLGLAALGDGQLRRRNSLAPIYDGIEGFGAETAATGPVAELVGRHLAPEYRPLQATPKAKAAAGGRLVADEAAFVIADDVDRPVLVALPSPGFVLALTGDADGTASEEATEALAAIIREEVVALASEGVVYVQLHNPLAGILLTNAGRERAKTLGLDPDALLVQLVAADAKVLEGLAERTPENLRTGLDLTTAGADYAKQGYDAAATTRFVATQPYDRLCVEYPQDEAARFPIDLLKAGTVVALGVVDVSVPEAEDVDALVARIDMAAAVVDIDDIAISTNGGFTSSPTAMTEPQQRAKLQLVEMTARYFWGNEL